MPINIERDFPSKIMSRMFYVCPREDQTVLKDPGPIVEYAIKNSKKGDVDVFLKAADDYSWKLEKCRSIAIGDTKGAWLDDVVRERNPRIALELGAYFGYSAIRIARIMEPGSVLLSLEIDPTCAKLTERVIEHVQLTDRIKVILGDSHNTIPQLKAKYGIDHIDLAFLDNGGTRYKKGLMQLLEAGLVEKGTVIVADNVIHHEGAQEYVDFIRNNEHFDSTLFETYLQYETGIVDGMEKSIFLG